MADDCLEYQSGNKDRYGRRYVKGRTWLTHRLAWAWANGFWDKDGPRIPDGMDVLHSCDNPACINPDHLSLGTHTENMRDMMRKGRQNVHFTNERNPNRKLTIEQVRSIREASGWGCIARLSRELGIHADTISRIRNGHAWVGLD